LGFFGKVASCFRWTGKERKLRRQFESDWQDSTAAFRGWKPYCACSKQDGDKLRKRLVRVSPELEADVRNALKNESEALSLAINKISVCSAKFGEIRDRDIHWRSAANTISAAASDLWKASSSLPGKEFAKNVDLRKRNIDAILREIPTMTQPVKVEQKLGHAKQQISEMRRLITEAEELIAGEPALAENVAAIGRMGVEQDIESSRSYQTLLRMQTEIQRSIRGSAYAAGHHMLMGARALCGSLRQDLQERHDLARAEINLWLDDYEVCTMFSLESFPQNLSPAQTQRWGDIRVEIRDLVARRAEKTRRVYALMNPTKRNMRFSIEQLRDWENLESFARSAKKNSTYRSPRG